MVVSDLLVDHLKHLILVQIVQLSHSSIRRQLKIVDVVVDRPEPAQDLFVAADVARGQLVLKRHQLGFIRVVQDGKLLARFAQHVRVGRIFIAFAFVFLALLLVFVGGIVAPLVQ